MDDMQMMGHYEDMGSSMDGDYYQRFDPLLFKHKPYLAEYVRQGLERVFSGIDRPGRMADLGCGTGFYYPVLAPMADRIWGVDFSGEMLQGARRVLAENGIGNVHLLRGDCRKLPLKNGSMDAVFSWDVLHHVTGPEGIDHMVKEIHRVLGPGGVYVGLEPNMLNPTMVFYCLMRPEEHGALTLHSRYLARRFSEIFSGVKLIPNNTIISYVDQRKIWIVNGLDRMLSRWPLRPLAFREVLLAFK